MRRTFYIGFIRTTRHPLPADDLTFHIGKLPENFSLCFSTLMGDGLLTKCPRFTVLFAGLLLTELPIIQIAGIACSP